MIYFRTDANTSIGMGHIMRCLSIADAFRDVGQEVAFVLADHRVEELVQQREYETLVLNSSYDDMDSELELWPDVSPELIIVDSYYVTEHYLKVLREKSKLVYIDDLGAFPYPVDILINYNVYGPDMDYGGLYHDDPPILLLGVTYAPLRETFRNVPKREPRKEVRDILFSTGGSDDLHLALNLVKMKPEGFNYHILIGTMNMDQEEIRRLAESQGNLYIHENVSDMRSLISSCDIAVSAAGSTLYEICACGVPLITYIIADNQIPGAEAFEKLGLAENCGDMRENEDGLHEIERVIVDLAESYDRRLSTVARMRDMIDGNGAQRIVEVIMRGDFTVISDWKKHYYD